MRKGLQDLATRPRNNVASLDVLRSIAILLVFSGHFGAEFGASRMIMKFPLVYFGWTGVDLFFVLSGLLIGRQLWKELQRMGRIEIGAFLLRRGFRIWPLYSVFVFLVLAEGVLFQRDLSGVWSDASFLSNYFHHQIGGGWSLSTEEQFYILMPIGLALLSRVLHPKRMWLLPLAALILLPMLRELSIRLSGQSPGAVREAMYSPIHTHSDGLAIGVLIAWCVVFKPSVIILSGVRKHLAPLLAIVLAIALYAWNSAVFSYSSLALIYGAATAYVLTLHPLSGVLKSKIFYVLSRLSYGIYLNHFGLLPRIVPMLRPWREAGLFAFMACYLIALAVCTAVAALTFLVIERPCLKMRERGVDSIRRRKQALSLVFSKHRLAPG